MILFSVYAQVHLLKRACGDAVRGAAWNRAINMVRSTCLLVAMLIIAARTALAAPVTQTLTRSASSITFGINSPNPSLRMNGSFKDFKGTWTLVPDSISQSSLELSLALSSAQLPPDQLLQTIFLQTAIARIPNRASTFKSSKIEHLHDTTYLVHGLYSWLNKQKPATVPVSISSATPTRSELRLLLDGSFVNKNVPPEFSALATSAEGSKGWTKAILVFTAPGRS